MKIFTVAAALMLSVSAAHAEDCEIAVAGNDQMQFDKRSIVVPKACKTFKVNLTHTGKLPKNVMGHNWVFTESSAMQATATEGMSAGAANNYVKAGDARVFGATKVIGGGESTSTEVDVSKLKPGTEYSFFCSFPDHWTMMKGTLTVAN
ncbi:azurin [Roseateles sp. 22389]|uniref:azurin n=1 Tax=Roseateles sp. 22389 TaxID=3453916 RepID=UPI003F86B860